MAAADRAELVGGQVCPTRWVRAEAGTLAPTSGSLLGGSLPSELAGYERLALLLDQGRSLLPDRSWLVEEAVELWRRPGLDTFVSLPRLRFEPFPHQLQTAQAVLRRMQGRAILADEVGLGKTIEAGLVLSELRLRGLADRALVVAPPGLIEQWREELERKFALPTTIAAAGVAVDPAGHEERPVVLASLHAARRGAQRDSLTAVRWDLVVVDEAHRLKNPRGASSALARSLPARYFLLLTATPVENRLDDLFQLVNLVRPGHLGTPSEFRSRHGPTGKTEPPRDVPGLRARMQEVMVRHRRSAVALMLPQRLAETLSVAPGEDEAELYGVVSERVRREGRGASPARALALRALQRLAGSSPQALAPALAKVGWEDLAARAARVPPGDKAGVLFGLLRGHRERDEKVVVFTGFRHTLDLLRRLAGDVGLPVAVYHGGLSRKEKEAAIVGFAADVPVLLTTEAAGEGRNLQFCHVMVNYDLPWNPMQIEQRLGRLHRIGQRHDVLLRNLVTKGTVEERILAVLEAKIGLFELVVGELDMILGRVEEDFDFERAVFSAHVESRDDAEFGARLEALGEDLGRARRDHVAARAGVDDLVGEVGGG